MKILITGATGYIGSHLLRYLNKEHRNDLIPLCRKLPEHFIDWKNEFQVIEADVTNLNELTEKIKGQIDCIIHLAAYNDVNSSKFPDQALMVNGIGTRNMLEIAKQCKCKTFIYFSTLQVYGKELHGTYTHETCPDCSDDYSLTHYIAEEYCRMFSLRYNLNVGIIRLSNGFGCPIHYKIDRWTLVPGSLCLSAFKEGRIVLKSSGKQNRDFVSLDYVSKCVDYLMKYGISGFNIYNITSEKLFSVMEIAEMVVSSAKTVLNRDVEITCESENPVHANKFLVKNNICETLFLTKPYDKTRIRDELITEIEKIFEMLKNNEGKHGPN